jgi:hypothetical protein
MDINTFIFADDKIATLDIKLYQNSPNTKGADIFKTLLGLNLNSQFKSVPLMVNKAGYKTIFKDYYIDLTGWNILETFIKTGSVPFHKAYRIGKIEKLYNIVIENIEKLNMICNIFGGIPEFDKYYDKFYTDDNLPEQEIYNPETPEQDIQNKYTWAILIRNFAEDQRIFEITHTYNEGWSASHERLTEYAYIYTAVLIGYFANVLIIYTIGKTI